MKNQEIVFAHDGTWSISITNNSGNGKSSFRFGGKSFHFDHEHLEEEEEDFNVAGKDDRLSFGEKCWRDGIGGNGKRCA